MRWETSREPDHGILDAPNPPRTVVELRATSAEQRGLRTRQQCLEAGMTTKAVRWRLERQLWVRVYPGVYQTLPGRDDWHTDALAAQLAVPGSAWSHRTPGFVHGLLSRPPRPIELDVDEGRRVVAPSGVVVHRRVDADRHVDELPWPWRVTAGDTVLDLAEDATDDDTLALLGRAFVRGLVTDGTLRELLANRARHSRRGLLTDVLGDVADGAESAMEVRFLRDVERAHGLPVGRRQRPTFVTTARVHDVAYEEQRVLVELDGRLGHHGAARVSDGIRDPRSATRGWLTVRAFWVDVAVTPCELAREMGDILVDRGWKGVPRACRRRSCVMRRSEIGG